MKINYIILSIVLFLSGGGLYYFFTHYNLKVSINNNKPLILCTTSIIADTVKNIIGDHANVKALMGPGIDPHLYKPCPRDVYALDEAQIIFFNGLHLEGKMVEILEGMAHKNKHTHAVTDSVDRALLRKTDYADIYDPHVWFDVIVWQEVSRYISKCLQEALPEFKDDIEHNNSEWLKKLDILHEYVMNNIAMIEPSQRILITAHDAFGYFGNRYGMQVEGLQGISTDAEIKMDDVSRLARIILDNNVKTIFVEQTISDRYLKGVKELVSSHKKSVSIGDQLYSDALGEEGTGAETYEKMVRCNVDTIVKGLQ